MPERCMDGKVFRIRQFDLNTQYVPVTLYGNPNYPLQRIPDIEQATPYNASGRVKRKQAKAFETLTAMIDL